MAEAKKRGRPKKVIEEPSVVNEKTQQIRMSEEDKVTVQQVAEKWSHVFQKYASQGFDNIASSWQNSWAQLNNPFLQNARIKQINAASAKMDQEDLQKALQNPPSAEDPLQRISMWLYYTNYVYNLLIKLNRDTPSYKYYALPQYVDKADMSTEAFKRESKLVDKILKSFKPNLTLKTVATQVNLEGKASYLPRISYTKDNVDFFVMQKLNPDMVKLTGFGSKQQFIASFNMAIFLQPAYDVSQYPEFIRQTWEDMLTLGIVKEDKKGNKILNPTIKLPQNHSIEWNGKYYIYWVQLPQDLCYTFYVDGAHPNMFPDTIGLFNDLSELDDYRWLQANLLSRGVNSVLTATVPLVKDPKPRQDSTAISTDVVMGFTDMFQSLVSSNILPFFAPFTDWQLHELENQPESMDIIYDRTRDLIATSGNSALMSITDKPSIASVKAAQLIQASRVDYLTRQFESFLNEVINSSFSLKYEWKVSLWGDIFNIREDIKQLKELVVSGMNGFAPKLLSAFDYTVEDYASACNYLDALGVEIILKEDEEANPVGRPKLADDEITNDNTGSSADAGTNVSAIKEFTGDIVNNSYDLSAIEDIITDNVDYPL